MCVCKFPKLEDLRTTGGAVMHAFDFFLHISNTSASRPMARADMSCVEASEEANSHDS